jgi:hypothetical protein
MRVVGWQTLMRNESEGSLELLRYESVVSLHHGGSIDRSSLVRDLSASISVGTRKMVIYA